MILGFGSLIIDNDNTTLCTDVENTLGQVSIMNLRLPYKFTRMGYGKSVGNVSFNNVEGTFTNVQRGLCGFIYAGEESLANLLNAFEKSGTKYDGPLSKPKISLNYLIEFTVCKIKKIFTI